MAADGRSAGNGNGTAICPGSYDPVTFGHLDIIRRTATVFDNVVVAVVRNPPRKQGTLFPVEERIRFIEEETAELPNVRVISFQTLLVSEARAHGARAIVKGLRAVSDYEYEAEMNALNRKLAPDVESIYLMSSPEFSFLSSSGVKELARFGGDVSEMVPAQVARRLEEALKR